MIRMYVIVFFPLPSFQVKKKKEKKKRPNQKHLLRPADL